MRGLRVYQELVERVYTQTRDQVETHTEPNAAQQVHGFLKGEPSRVPEEPVRPPRLVGHLVRCGLEQHLPGLPLVLDHLPDDLAQVIEKLSFRLPQRSLIRQLEKVADDLASFPVQAPKGEADLREPLQHLPDFLGQNEARQVDKHTGAEPGAGVGGAGRKIEIGRASCRKEWRARWW